MLSLTLQDSVRQDMKWCNGLAIKLRKDGRGTDGMRDTRSEKGLSDGSTRR